MRILSLSSATKRRSVASSVATDLEQIVFVLDAPTTSQVDGVCVLNKLVVLDG